MTNYNATVIQTWNNSPGSGTSVAYVEVINGKLQMLKGNSITHTGYEMKVLKVDIPELDGKAGDAAYHVYIMQEYKRSNSNIQIIMDDCQAYKNVINKMGIPPSYKV